MYNLTFEQYKKWEFDMLKKGISDSMLNVKQNDRDLMAQFTHEHLWNALQVGYEVPFNSIISVDEDILRSFDILVENGVVRYKDVNTGEWKISK